MLENIIKLGKQQKEDPRPKPQKNICFGSAKTTGDGSAETMLAADVNLVASGVGKGCTEDNLKEFLIGKGINPVEVEMMTKKEIINDVRTLTFRVAVKPAEYEAALKPEVWPYRVAVRHYRAPRRDNRSGGSWQGQSERSGGQINTGGEGTGMSAGGGHEASVGGARAKVPGQYLPPGHARHAGQNQQRMGQHQPGQIEMSNLFNLLNALGGEMPPSH